VNKRNSIVAGVVLAALLGGLSGVASAEPNKNIGKVYFKMICTVCHMTSAGKAIPPNTRTMKEWSAYLDADKHDATGKTNPKVSYYLSKAYRETIKDTNKAAEKFLNMPDEEVAANVRAFVVGGAKDSDTPASCQ
jgi:hypothetical protein